MATVKGITSGSGCIKYIMQDTKTNDKLIDGINCMPETSVEEMKFTKEIFHKTEGIQYYHFTQNFKPGETTPEQAHEIGREFANRLAGTDYQAVLATHTDREHIHNHVVINSVSFETGKKFHFSPQDMRELKEYSNELCRENGLSTIDFSKKADKKITTGEYRLMMKDKESWKNEIRDAVDRVKEFANNFEELKKYLSEAYNIELKIQNKDIKYKHQSAEKFCGGRQLGELYTKEKIENDLIDIRTEKKATELYKTKDKYAVVESFMKEKKGHKESYEKLNLEISSKEKEPKYSLVERLSGKAKNLEEIRIKELENLKVKKEELNAKIEKINLKIGENESIEKLSRQWKKEDKELQNLFVEKQEKNKLKKAFENKFFKDKEKEIERSYIH